MRNLFLILLLSTAAVPAAASRPDDGEDRRSRQSASEDDGDSRRAARSARSSRSAETSNASGESRRGSFVERRSEPPQAQTNTAPSEQRSGRGEWRRSRGDDSPRVRAPDVLTARPAESPTTVVQRDRRSSDGSFHQRSGEQRAQHDGRRRWSGDWRRDNRYDWRRHRDRNRSVFRIGLYFDPFGWDYRRWSVGRRLRPAYYQSNYWLNDPWMYRLPPAYGPYRWVRYWDDALLVNTYTGEVVDVLYSFFW